MNIFEFMSFCPILTFFIVALFCNMVIKVTSEICQYKSNRKGENNNETHDNGQNQ